MNLVSSYRDNLPLRIILNRCSINVHGETFDCTITDKISAFWVEYDDGIKRTLKIALGDITPLTDGEIYYFNAYTDYSMVSGTLFIPGSPLDDDEELEDDDE